MHTPLVENQIRQYIDAEQARKAWLAAERRAQNYRSNMYWKTVKGRDYLYREYSTGSAKCLGAEQSVPPFGKGRLGGI